MTDMKQHICDVAASLFTQKGYSYVSMREIAASADISLGTLTYHYAHKKDLLIAIMDTTIDTFSYTQTHTIAELNEFISRLIKSVENAPFYFSDGSVYNSFPDLCRRHEENVSKLGTLFYENLLSLTKLGYFSAELTKNRAESLTMLLMLSHISWLKHNATWSPSGAIPFSKILQAQWAALIPYLTEKGLAEYQNLPIS